MQAAVNAFKQRRLLNRLNRIGPGVFNPYPRLSKQAYQDGYMKPNILKSFRRS